MNQSTKKNELFETSHLISVNCGPGTFGLLLKEL